MMTTNDTTKLQEPLDGPYRIVETRTNRTIHSQMRELNIDDTFNTILFYIVSPNNNIMFLVPMHYFLSDDNHIKTPTIKLNQQPPLLLHPPVPTILNNDGVFTGSLPFLYPILFTCHIINSLFIVPHSNH